MKALWCKFGYKQEIVHSLFFKIPRPHLPKCVLPISKMCFHNLENATFILEAHFSGNAGTFTDMFFTYCRMYRHI